MNLARDIKVELSFVATAEGGKTKPVRSGYTPQFYYDGYDWAARHTYEQEEVHPGETAVAYLTFLSPERHVGKIRPGMEFLCREGQRTVAKGRVLEILELESSAKRTVEGEKK